MSIQTAEAAQLPPTEHQVESTTAAAASSSSTTTDDYESALVALMSPLHQSTTKEAIEQAGARRTRTVLDIQTYLQRIGMPDNAFSNKKIVHVTGTKGKGSVSCLCESILRRRYQLRTGLFTSPHLLDIRERIRLNGQIVSKHVFGRAYWSIRQKLEEEMNERNDDEENDELPVLPGYFRMLTLMALYIFLHFEFPNDPTAPSSSSSDSDGVQVMILEVGMGGRYDATNCITTTSNNNTKVCGVTLLDYDHCRVLGYTLPEIAWEKGGIFCTTTTTTRAPHPQRQQADYQAALKQLEDKDHNKKNEKQQRRRRLFALDTNTEAALQCLRLCAYMDGNEESLHLVGSTKNVQIPPQVPIGLQGSHQRINAELALALCRAVVTGMPAQQDHHDEDVDDDPLLYRALAETSWPGRCQTFAVTDPAMVGTATTKPVTLRLDGAHTVHSMAAGLEWFQSVSAGGSSCRILIFNCSHERNPLELLQVLSLSVSFRGVYFCRSDSERPSAIPKPKAAELLRDTTISSSIDQQEPIAEATWQDTLAILWKHLENSTRASSEEAAVDVASNFAGGVKEALNRGMALGEHIESVDRIDVFVTGSLYLVGSMLAAMNWHEKAAAGQLNIK